jgi:putative hydrolase of the HAD superfamily
LDIDDTLIDCTAAIRRTLHALTGRADMWPLWDLITEEHVAMVVAGTLEYASMHHRRTECFLGELGVVADAADVAGFERRRLDLLSTSWRLFDDVLPCLEWLRAAGVLLAAVTNASGAHQRKKLADLGLAAYFDHIAIAGELGVAKPDPVMFGSVCLALGCDPSETVHIGDKLDSRWAAIRARPCTSATNSTPTPSAPATPDWARSGSTGTRPGCPRRPTSTPSRG